MFGAILLVTWAPKLRKVYKIILSEQTKPEKYSFCCQLTTGLTVDCNTCFCQKLLADKLLQTTGTCWRGESTGRDSTGGAVVLEIAAWHSWELNFDSDALPFYVIISDFAVKVATCVQYSIKKTITVYWGSLKWKNICI